MFIRLPGGRHRARVCRRHRDRLGDRGRSPTNRLTDQPRPTFRTEANYVRVDAYTTTKDGVPVDDLRRDEFEVLEDKVPQTIDQFATSRPRDSSAPRRSDGKAGLPLQSSRYRTMPVPPGTRVGLYEIVAFIGSGGMGEVYRANDTRLNRPVAIKFLSATLADAEARRRFQREAQVASSLNHPHILTVYDAGELDDRQYLVTELIDGGTLSDWATAKPRSYHDIADLLSGVADGLAAAHDAGIVHRDIKPANVLVARNGYATLVDFGLAKLQERPDEHRRHGHRREHQTGRRGRHGAYMSPEQAAGKRLDRRSDVFSFGVMLYELVAGHRPFDGRTDLHVLQLIQHGEPVRARRHGSRRVFAR